MASWHAGMLGEKGGMVSGEIPEQASVNPPHETPPSSPSTHGTGGLVLFVFCVPAFALLIEAMVG